MFCLEIALRKPSWPVVLCGNTDRPHICRQVIRSNKSAKTLASGSRPQNSHMIEAVADRLEGAQRQLRRRWSDELKARAVADWSQARASRRSRIGSAFTSRSSLAGASCDPKRSESFHAKGALRGGRGVFWRSSDRSHHRRCVN